MTTSGTYRHSVTFNDVAEEVCDILQASGDGETLSADLQVRCRKSANFMLKAWEGQGIHLWTQKEGTLFLVKSQASYPFATSNLANTWYETTLSAAEAAGQTVLSCTSTANMAVADIIGIVLDNDTLHWSTVSSKTSTTVTIGSALPSAAASGSFVRNYVASSFIPVNRIMTVRRRDSTTSETSLQFESREDYFSLPDKVSTGQPVQAYFSRQQYPGTMYVWPAPSSAEPCINFTYECPIQTITAGTETLDIPDYWYEAFIYGLAERMILKLGCSETRAMFIKTAARESLALALEFDSELYPIKVSMLNA